MASRSFIAGDVCFAVSCWLWCVCDDMEMKQISGVHMVVSTTAPQNPITLAAKNAFWDLPRSEIIRFSKLKKVDILWIQLIPDFDGGSGGSLEGGRG